MFKKLIVSLGVVAAGLVLAPAASAVTVLTLESDVTTDKYKQQVNSPCIFGHSCSMVDFR